MIIKVELHEGQAYILDEWGSVWQFREGSMSNLPEIRLVTVLNREGRDLAMEPQLARFNT
jgi:hypothetical protein